MIGINIDDGVVTLMLGLMYFMGVLWKICNSTSFGENNLLSSNDTMGTSNNFVEQEFS